MTLWALRPDFTLGETIKGEMAKHEPWDVPSFKAYAEKADFYPKFTEMDPESH